MVYLFIEDIFSDKETFYLVGPDYNNLSEVISSYSLLSNKSAADAGRNERYLFVMRGRSRHWSKCA